MQRYNNIHLSEPEGFVADLDVAACYLNVEGSLLFLRNAEENEEGGMWGVPAGKIEPNETPLEAIHRELFEETGIRLEEGIDPFGTLYITKPGFTYRFHVFGCCLPSEPVVTLSDEHSQYVWASIDDAHSLDLMAGAKDALNFYREWKRKP